MMDDEHTSDARQPLSRGVMVLWVLSPTVILLPCLAFFGWSWSYLGWVVFFALLLNLYAFSAMNLWDRGVADWEMKAVPFTLALSVVNGALVVLIDTALRALGFL